MGKTATREAYGKSLAELGEKNPKVVVLDADLAKSTKTADFAKAFPERFFDMGIAEANMMGTAAGLAAAGKIPFASTFAMFAVGRAFEQIRNSIAYPKLNVKIAATHAGISVGEDGASHQSIEDLSLMRSVPNMTVICPADARETTAVINACAEYDGPVYIRLGRLGVDDVFDDSYQFKWGKGILVREGRDVALIGTGLMTYECLLAAEELEKEGISAAVVNIHTLKPIDKKLIQEVAQTCGAIVTAEEHSIIGGLGSAVAEVLVENHPVPMERVGVQDTFGESGDPKALLEKYGLTAKAVITSAKKVIARK